MRSPTSAADIPILSDPYDAHSRKTRLSFAVPEHIARQTVIVTNPEDIYELAHSCREQNLHALIRRYVNQILHGCQNPLCTTPTCLSYQKRTAKGPLRKYTPLSARAIACFLVSERDPEAGLCRNTPVIPFEIDIDRVAKKSQGITTSHPRDPRRRQASVEIANPIQRVRATIPETKDLAAAHDSQQGRPGNAQVNDGHVQHNESEQNLETLYRGVDRAVTRDPKSFTQNLFDTIALRMLEWVPLRPRSESSKQTTSPVRATKYPQRPQKDIGLLHSHGSHEGAPDVNGVLAISTADTKISDIEPSKRSLDKSTIDREQIPHNAHPRFDGAKRHKVPNGGLIKPTTTRQSVPNTSVRMRTVRETRDVVPEDLSNRHTQAIDADRTPKSRTLGTPTTETGNRLKTIQQNDRIGLSKLKHGRQSSQSLTQSIQEQQVPSLTLLTEPILDDLKSMASTREEQKLKENSSAEESSLDKEEELTSFIKQSVYFVLKDPNRLICSMFPMPIPPNDIDSGSVFRSIALLYALRPADEIHQHLWQSLRKLLIPPDGRMRLLREEYHNNRDSALSGGGPPKPREVDCQILSDEHAAKLCCFIAYALTRFSLRSTIIDTWHASDMTVWRIFGKALGQGTIFPNDGADEAPGDLLESFIHLTDKFDDELAFRLVDQVVAVITNRLAFYEMSKSQKSRGKLFLSKKTRPANILQMLLHDIASFRKVQHQFVTFEGNLVSSGFLERVKALFLREWDGKAVAERSTSTGGAIQILAAMFEDKSNLGLLSSDFVTPILSDRLDPIEMPVEWLAFRANNKTLHLLSYSFLFPPDKVVTYFRAINYAAMSKAFENAMAVSRHVQGMAFRGFIPIHNNLEILSALRPAMATYLVVQVRRDNVLSDAIDQLWRRERRELLRPLKVRMGMEEGEEGVDHGGVQQEFFRVVFAEALNPDLGMFTIDSRTRMTWFQPGSPEQLYKFEVLGLLMSLAIYNSVTLPVTFPLALYRKLLGLKVKKLDHIGDGWPELTKGLHDLLEWSDGDVGDIFLRTYEFTYEFAGQQTSVDMEAVDKYSEWPPKRRNKGKGKAKSASFVFSPADQMIDTNWAHNPQFHLSEDDEPFTLSSILHRPSRLPEASDWSTVEAPEASLVTNENRAQYVKDYIFWLTDKSIRPQYEAFARGFYTCLDRTALSIFTPDALKSVVEGIQEIDIQGLKEATRYEDGFERDQPFIQDLWNVIQGFTVDQQRQLLEFVTASDRVPVNGIKSIMFVIQRNGDSDLRLPTSMTCFGRLLLPQYSSKEILKEKLVKAIENSKGFGAA